MIECDICMDNPAITKYKSGVRGQYWEYYCYDCDQNYGYENAPAGNEEEDLET